MHGIQKRHHDPKKTQQMSFISAYDHGRLMDGNNKSHCVNCLKARIKNIFGANAPNGKVEMAAILFEI